jgi:Protein of unknown function (DUF1569)
MNLDLQELQRELAHSLRGLDSAQTQLRPLSGPDGWSIQQIVEHLLLTYESTEDALKARLAKGIPTRAKASLLQRVQQCAVMRFGYFPDGRKAPPPVTPRSRTQPISGGDLTHAVTEHLSNLDALCQESERLFGSSARCANHTVLGPLKMDHWRRFQLVHGRHHIKQIRAIRGSHHLSAEH